MLRKAIAGIMVVCVLMIVAPAFAQEAMHGSHSTQGMSEGTASGKIDYFIAVVVAAAVAMMIASSAAAIAQSRAIFKAVEGIARQPSASGKITTTMVIGLALIESLAIYVLVIALILFFANPFTNIVVSQL